MRMLISLLITASGGSVSNAPPRTGGMNLGRKGDMYVVQASENCPIPKAGEIRLILFFFNFCYNGCVVLLTGSLTFLPCCQMIHVQLIKTDSKQPTAHQSDSASAFGDKFQIVCFPALGMFQCFSFHKHWKSNVWVF